MRGLSPCHTLWSSQYGTEKDMQFCRLLFEPRKLVVLDSAWEQRGEGLLRSAQRSSFSCGNASLCCVKEQGSQRAREVLSKAKGCSLSHCDAISHPNHDDGVVMANEAASTCFVMLTA